MRQSPLFSGIVYILLGALFTYFAIQDVSDDGWGVFTYLLVLLATFDVASGLKMIGFYIRFKSQIKK
ncbi:YdiK family protein [Neobacillus sp. PS3-34]|uniref:YdiK family protein n=1 Tax=Neobacillus sp. PS3-34 TaxID=3070678 RepID=UPI0027E20409|nr:YdiK family protein [Neobacillus sp. PS3-34]WML50175.1 YdiK family protein [Neobacillus sp. PS3-34]